MIDLVDRPDRKICVTVVRYNDDQPDSSYAQVRKVAKKKEDKNLQQILHVNSKLDDFIFLLDEKSSVYDKISANQSICSVL